MTNHANQIGKNIINNENGIGEIIEIVKMSGDEDFYRVSFKKSESINFFSVTNQKNYRMISSKSVIEEAIDLFINNNEEKSFKSIQEKINFYKKSLKSSDVKEIAKLLSWLNKEDEVHTGIKTQFDKTLKSFVLEISYVLEIKNIEAWKKLGLNKNNKY